MSKPHIRMLKTFINLRTDWLKSQLQNFGASSPEAAVDLIFKSTMVQETQAEIAISKTLLQYLQDGDAYDEGLLILSAQQNPTLPTEAILKAMSAIYYELKE